MVQYKLVDCSLLQWLHVFTEFFLGKYLLNFDGRSYVGALDVDMLQHFV